MITNITDVYQCLPMVTDVYPMVTDTYPMVTDFYPMVAEESKNLQELMKKSGK
jgi:hypothetical protein